MPMPPWMGKKMKKEMPGHESMPGDKKEDKMELKKAISRKLAKRGSKTMC